MKKEYITSKVGKLRLAFFVFFLLLAATHTGFSQNFTFSNFTYTEPNTTAATNDDIKVNPSRNGIAYSITLSVKGYYSIPISIDIFCGNNNGVITTQLASLTPQSVETNPSSWARDGDYYTIVVSPKLFRDAVFNISSQAVGTSATKIYVVIRNTVGQVLGNSSSNGLGIGINRNPLTTTVTDFRPTMGAAPGSRISIYGTNFTNVQSVAFGNTPAASFQVDSPGSITAIVPNVTGGVVVPIRVTTSLGVGVSPSNFSIHDNSIPSCRDVVFQNTAVIPIAGTDIRVRGIKAGSRADLSSYNGIGPVIIANGTSKNFEVSLQAEFLDGFIAEAGSNLQVSTVTNGCTTGGATPLQESPPDQFAAMTSSTVEEQPLEVYPNPVSDMMTVKFREENGAKGNSTRTAQTSLMSVIYNSFGREVRRVTLQPGQTTVDVRTLQRGIYYLHTVVNGTLVKTRFSVDH